MKWNEMKTSLSRKNMSASSHAISDLQDHAYVDAEQSPATRYLSFHMSKTSNKYITQPTFKSSNI